MGEAKPYRLILFSSDKEELIDRIIDLDKEVRRLQKENELLREKLNTPPKTRKEQEKKESLGRRPKPPHQWGQKEGHPGVTRAKPAQADREVRQILASCPDCAQALDNPVETTEHIQEDIIPSRVVVTRYLRSRYWCPCCKKVVDAPYAPDEIPHSYLGPLALITMTILKYHHGLPGNKIKELMETLSGLKVTEGAIAQALQRMSLWLKVETDEILKALRDSPYLHMDETGWKINGKGHWLWAAVNERLAYFQIAASRGSKVAKSILGDVFKGILITDFFSAYNKLVPKQQKCLVHLLRELKKCKARDAPQDYIGPYRKLRRIIRDGLRLAQGRKDLEAVVFNRRRELLDKRLIDFACGVYSNKDWKRLSKRILKHHNQILAFLDTAGLPSNNNQAERSIRPHVIIRNRSFQNRTEKGAQAHATLTSLLESLKLQGRNPVQELQAAYLAHRKGFAQPILFAKA